MSTTFSPPEELPTGRGVYPCLIVPFGEEVVPWAEVEPRSYSWGNVRLPRRPIDVVNGHDGEVVGTATSFVQRRDGLWAALKLGHRGEQILRRGLGVSAEVVGDVMTHVALVGAGTPAFASAQVLSTAGAVLDAPKAALRIGVDPSTGLVAFPPPMPTRAPAPAPSWAAVVNLSEHRRLLAALAGPDPELEVARARTAYQDRLESAREAQVDWEAHLVETMARNKVVFEAQVVAADGAIAAQEWKARHEALEARAERARRRWWHRIGRWFR